MKKPTDQHPLWNLLLLPAGLIGGMGLLCLGSVLDAWLFSGAGGTGHGIPVFTVLAFLLAGGFCIAIFILTIIRIVKGYRRRQS